MKTVEVHIEGMTCSSCALNVKNQLEKKGAEEVNISFVNKEGSFKIEDHKSPDSYIKTIKQLGYQVSDRRTESSKKKNTLALKLIIGLIFTLPLILNMFINWSWLRIPYVQLILTLPVFLIGILHFGKSAFNALKSGQFNMDVLIITGALSAFIYSLYGTILQLGNHYQFYETASSIITIVLLGNFIEHVAIQKTTSAVGELMQLQKKEAQLVQGEQMIKTPIEALKIGDIIRVNSGDAIPLDGEIVRGRGYVNEALLTGESLSKEKNPGDTIVSGSLLEQGSVDIRIKTHLEDNTLSKIIQWVKKAQTQKPKIQNLADKVSNIFVPAVLIVAVLTFIILHFFMSYDLQEAMLRSIAVLVISCPCALGLAVPTAVVVGVGKSARQGALIKGADVLETLLNADTFIFDKTGTLTDGNFSVSPIHVFDKNLSLEYLTSLIYELEIHSSHPIAQSIVKKLHKDREIKLQNITETKGKGVSGLDEEHNVWMLGSSKIIDDLHKTEDIYDLYLLKNKDLVAAFNIEDQIKEGAKDLVNYLNDHGVRTVLLSGDKLSKCKKIAQELGISEVHAEKSPEEKLQLIESNSQSHITVMIGDGINDAPALSRAHLGISLSNASQVAIQAAQVIILNDHLDTIKKTMQVAQQTIKTVKQNLFWAFFYNICAIPLAILGMVSPMIAALAMAFSDIIVVGNSLRLKLKFRK